MWLTNELGVHTGVGSPESDAFVRVRVLLPSDLSEGRLIEHRGFVEAQLAAVVEGAQQPEPLGVVALGDGLACHVVHISRLEVVRDVKAAGRDCLVINILWNVLLIGLGVLI